MLPIEEAWARLVPFLEPLAVEARERRDCLGRVLGEGVVGTVDVPPADVSAMDGYALAGEMEAGGVLEVTGRIAAGEAPGRRLEPGKAVRIMTGAPVPEGADRVVRFEDTDHGTDRVRVDVPPPAGANVRRRAEVLAGGDPLMEAGTVLIPAALALAAAHGLGELPVHRAPRVAVLPTGDEVVPPHRVPEPGQIRDTHTDFLLAAGRNLGLAFEPLGIAPDDPRRLGEMLAAGLEGADVLLVGGGVSVGELDFVEDELDRLACRPLFTAVAVQPGKPLVAMVREAADDPDGRRRLVFGLPGNPGSVMVTFQLFVRPALCRLLGRRTAAPLDGLQSGELAAPAPGAKSRDRFLPATLRVRDGRLLAAPVAARGSHDMVAHARAQALLHLPAGSPPAPAGAPCQLLPSPLGSPHPLFTA